MLLFSSPFFLKIAIKLSSVSNAMLDIVTDFWLASKYYLGAFCEFKHGCDCFLNASKLASFSKNDHTAFMITIASRLAPHTTRMTSPPSALGRTSAIQLSYPGEFYDQVDAKWIVIRRSLWGRNDTPCGWPPGVWPPAGLI
jgi:hypothetical protein